MASLFELQTKWIQLHDKLGESFEGQLLAAPFFSIPGDEGVEDQKRPILLVGKATAGDWGKNEYAKARERSIRKCVAERLNSTSGHLEWRKKEDLRPSAFWRFRNGLGQIAQSVIWTNLAKIGVQKGNPKWQLVRKQAELACRTLTAEIEEYRPALVVLVTGEFGRHEIIWPMFGGKDTWREEPNKLFSWQERSNFLVPVLWTKHPGIKRGIELKLWLTKVRELYDTSTKQPTLAT